MNLPPTSPSAEKLYQEALRRWDEIIDLSLYDDPDIIRPLMVPLETARELDAGHVKSRVLLGDILIELGADEEANEVLNELIALEPRTEAHVAKQSLLRKFQADRSFDNKWELCYFVRQRWIEKPNG